MGDTETHAGVLAALVIWGSTGNPEVALGLLAGIFLLGRISESVSSEGGLQ